MSNEENNPGKRGSRRFLVVVPFVVLVLFFSYLWLVSGVLPSQDKHPNGRTKAEGYVKRTGLMTYQRHGHWVTYYPGGAKASEGFYERGECVGSWSYWDEAGNATTQPSAALVSDTP